MMSKIGKLSIATLITKLEISEITKNPDRASANTTNFSPSQIAGESVKLGMNELVLLVQK